MELSDYINLTLEEIARGIKKADATYKTMGGRVLTETTSAIEGIPYTAEMVNGEPCYKPIINVRFKVNVQMQNTSAIKGDVKGSIKVLEAGAKTSSGNTATHTEELSFSIPLVLPDL